MYFHFDYTEYSYNSKSNQISSVSWNSLHYFIEENKRKLIWKLKNLTARSRAEVF